MQRLKNVREKRGMTQRQLSIASGITQLTISMIENGRTRNPSFGTIERLAQALSVRPEMIFTTQGIG
jgi:transcriptional regulator with XRE-family HTH domain